MIRMREMFKPSMAELGLCMYQVAGNIITIVVTMITIIMISVDINAITTLMITIITIIMKMVDQVFNIIIMKPSLDILIVIVLAASSFQPKSSYPFGCAELTTWKQPCDW